ncbi:putative membrane protein [Roseivivax lentus]|uniref:Putative membrane protein n=1 Tax=Roseivivax lentus TaxID=633194 RepID=A0A1N7L5E3_9RHOB|nr:TIGR01620 family protein [Roseivivax lentus]SIS69011.1 putative membrane protein [Roseivivax lentus]
MNDPDRKGGRRRPVLIEIDDAQSPTGTGVAPPGPADAPPVPELGQAPGADGPPQGAAMANAAALASRRPSRLARWFWALAGMILTTVLSIAAWNFATGLLAANPILGWLVTGLFALFLLVTLLIAIKELSAFSRLKRLDQLQRAADSALSDGGLEAARAVTTRLTALYQGRDDTRWGRERFAERQGDVFDAEALLHLAEREVLGPLDQRATAEVQAAARQVAAVTALVPLAFADVAAALSSNLRMIRRIAEIYGGRSGTLGSWRLTRAVFSHLVATGAVAVGDDMLEPILGGGLLARLSRRFGEGLVNGALTARVGVAAMEVCRPLPFSAARRPSVRRIVTTSLTDLFGKGDGKTKS